MAFTLVATAFTLREFAGDRDNYKFLSPFLNSLHRTIPHTVSNSTVGLFVPVLGLIVVVQLILFAVTQLGRHRAAIPIVVEVALWMGFCLSSYEMTKKYQANFNCSGPRCLVTYPSVMPYLTVGLVTGAVIGVGWRVAYKHDRRGLSSADRIESVPNLSG
jgi:hypothetical protein